MNVSKILSVAVVLVLLTAPAQAQLPTLILPDSWDGTGWIFSPPKGCGVDYQAWLGAQNGNPAFVPNPDAMDPVIGPIVGFRFEILDLSYHNFWGVALPEGFSDALDAATFTVTPDGGMSTTIETSSWSDVVAGDVSNWAIFGDPYPGVKAFEIHWDDPELFFNPENPSDQDIFPVWWGVAPHDCQATVKMSPIEVPEPSVLALLATGVLGLLVYRCKR